MEGHIFVRMIEDWFRDMISVSVGRKESRSSFTGMMPGSDINGDLQKFKNWFSLALRITEVWSEGVSVSPEDVIFRSTIMRTHSRLLMALSMFTDKELIGLFGMDRANQIRGMAREIIYTPERYSHSNFLNELPQA